MKVKVIANYLPQFHRIPENDAWWGEGFTDWMAVKNAKPLFDWQYQPIEPLNDNYYSLDDIEVIRQQAQMAKKYGIEAFGIYHYWFSSEQKLLTKPAELLLSDKSIDIGFCFLWDNVSWKRTWSNVKGNDWSPLYDQKNSINTTDSSNGILAELKYGDEKDWENHFNYLLPFFLDDRYIKVSGKPLFAIFKPENDFDTIKQMIEYWDMLAKKSGLPGIYCITRRNLKNIGLSTQFCYSPISIESVGDIFRLYLPRKINGKLERVNMLSYKKLWKGLLSKAKHSNKKALLSGFAKYDDTARRGKKASIVKGSSPEKFEKYFGKLVEISKKQNKEYVFLTAWNEWGEGAYLEPDKKDGYAYLEAVKRIMDKQ
ncbi:MAG: glycoside hydrolase family 99-like domain-containing protein [Clostridia bacterium]|nr:glycoside hydrolase family 99-like domain-containing protein [Clostridia bacterium]